MSIPLVRAFVASVGAVVTLCAHADEREPHQLTAAEAEAVLCDAHACLEMDPEMDYADGRLIVRFRDDIDADTRRAIEEAFGCRLVRTLGDTGVRHLIASGCAEATSSWFRLLPYVEYAEPDFVLRSDRTPDDGLLRLQWGMGNLGQSTRGGRGVVGADIGALDAWDVRTGDGSSIVAVIDDGVNWRHPDLRDNIWVNVDEIPGNGIDDDGNGYIDDVRGWDFLGNDADPYQLGSDHGTHVAGIVAAQGDNGMGVAGVLWDAQIMPLRFIGPRGGFVSDAIRALDYAVANGARVSNNSWGGTGFSYGLLFAIQRANARGHIVVASAGNNALNSDFSPYYPAGYASPNVISVAATDNADRLATFSNFGASTVDIAAPGVFVASTYGNGYAWASGTSMSSPHVAGVVAAVMEAWPEWSVAQVRERVLGSARPAPWLAGWVASGGVLDYAAALEGATPQDPESVVEPEPLPEPMADEEEEAEEGSSEADTPGPGNEESGPKLSAPSGVRLTGSGTRRVLVWSPSDGGAEKYEVQREILRGGAWGRATVVYRLPPSTTSQALAQDPYVDLRFRVRGVADDTPGEWSGWVTLRSGG